MNVTSTRDRRTSARELDRLLRQRHLHSVFQPVVRLSSGATVGYEALIRGPHGSPLASAEALLAAAYETGRVAELDWVARASACRAALAAGLPAGHLLFINIEPIAFDSECPADLRPDIEQAFASFAVLLEITERSLDRDPGALLDGLNRYRPEVAGFALDDVGTNAATLSMLAMVAPAVIKLDLRIAQGGPNAEIAGALDIVWEEAERTGAIILAEGIETPAHREFAASVGAQLGQGYLFGPATPMAEHRRRLTERAVIAAGSPRALATPFDALDGRSTSCATAELLAEIGGRIRSSAAQLAAPVVHIAHLPASQSYGPVEHEHLADLTRRGVATAVLGSGVPGNPGSGIRGARAASDADLGRQWAVITLSPAGATALLARAVDDNHTAFDFAITHDKQRAIAAARCLFRRLGPLDPR
jgi:EAL domain-containing protein (putative c-di-GMP-specific phosphodiesterase class I)